MDVTDYIQYHPKLLFTLEWLSIHKKELSNDSCNRIKNVVTVSFKNILSGVSRGKCRLNNLKVNLFFLSIPAPTKKISNRFQLLQQKVSLQTLMGKREIELETQSAVPFALNRFKSSLNYILQNLEPYLEAIRKVSSLFLAEIAAAKKSH